MKFKIFLLIFNFVFTLGCKGKYFFHSKVTNAKESAQCETCHEQEFSDWKISAHGISGTNIRFQEAYKLEKRASCIHCHAPLTLTDHKISRVKDLSEGIGCVSCHEEKYAFPVFISIYKNNYDCGYCHNFPFPEGDDLDLRINPHPKGIGMQTTEEEFQDTIWYKKKNYTCLNCHFSKGKHSLGGPIDREKFLKYFHFNFRYVKTENILLTKIKIFKLGHHFPTGDLFRSFWIEVFDTSGKRIGQTKIQKNMNMRTRKIISNNRLIPDSEGKVENDIWTNLTGVPKRCLVSYRLQGEIENLLNHIPTEQLIIELYNGECGG